jgi:hypothetical protein
MPGAEITSYKPTKSAVFAAELPLEGINVFNRYRFCEKG